MNRSLSKIEILRLFREKIIDFFDALIEQFPNEGDFIMLRILVEDAPVEATIKNFHKVVQFDLKTVCTPVNLPQNPGRTFHLAAT